MTPAPSDRIFLADQRGLTETGHFRRWSTLNFSAHLHEHRAPLGRVRAVNEEWLAGGQCVALDVATPTYLLVVPLTGAVSVHGPQQEEAAPVDVEALQVLALDVPGSVTFCNPYPEDVVNFLHVWVDLDPATRVPSASVAFTADELADRLAPVLPAAAGFPFALNLGRLGGRREAVYAPHSPRSLVYAWVLAGAFEVAGRLLHAGDSVALWDAAAVEVEALSNDALILVLETAR